MCWKCYLCCCFCSRETFHTREEIANADIDRAINAGQARLKQAGVRSIEDKNWAPLTLHGQQHFIHGSGTGPAIIRQSGGLDPAFGKEEIRVAGRPPGKYLLAFPTTDNLVPDGIQLKGAAARLWGVDEFPFIYIFHVPNGTQVFRTPFAGTHAGTLNAETGFAAVIPWANIDRVFQYNKQTKTYDRNPIQ